MPTRGETIATGESEYAFRGAELLRVAERPWARYRPELPPPKGIAEDVVAYVEVNHGRWVVACPLTDKGARCGGAQVASETDPFYYCCVCGNADVGGRWIRVIWPPPTQRRAIERALLERPNPDNRNWLASETVNELQVENRLFLS